MNQENQKLRIAVLGAGTMGRGIAQMAAVTGHDVVLFDLTDQAVNTARVELENLFERLSDKNKSGYEDPAGLLSRIEFVSGDHQAARTACLISGLVIEAIVEDLAAKHALLEAISEGLAEEIIIGSNTSSLSITGLAAAVTHPERFLGIHFFNPAALMPLVEVVPGLQTDERFPARVIELLEGWGKAPVLAKDTPGFIVNRVARPFYGEALRIFEEGIADISEIDIAVKEQGGFRMGPFELMDFIGNDINLAVSEIVFRDMYYDPRYRPSVLQKRYVEAGYLGRKSERGYYDYKAGEQPASGVSQNAEKAQMIFDRIFALLVNEAADALYFGIASREDIDRAMTKGVNYPRGLLEWADEYGIDRVFQTLTALQAGGDDRYRPSRLLRNLADSGSTFY